jgi:signal transduction histidine kinase
LAEAGALAQRNWLSQVNAAVLDCVREGIALVGLDHELVLANAAMERMAERLSMPIPAAIGASGASSGSSGDGATADPEAYFAHWEVMLADTEEPIADELEIAGIVLERYTAPVDDETGARIGRLVVLRDVTREREVDQLKSDLMATVSHELRTPLASVLGYAELLRTRKLDASARDEIVSTVHREAKRLSSLIDDFLDVQAIEQDRLLLTREPFSVSDLLSEQVRTFSGQSQKHRLELALCSEPVVAFGDRARIAQVMANLLSNAIKYSPDGGLVSVEASCTADSVLVAVTDEGLGIPLAEQKHVFEKFFRVQQPGFQRLGGTGLGLALAHEIVAAHGGQMGFESTEGTGSRFWFTLPTN